jgi:hypothetical protein
MRTLMKMSIPVEAGNRGATSGALEATLKKLMSDLKPEAAYFYADNGMRTALYVFDMKSPSDIPVIAEPLFQQFNANVEFHPVMNAADLQEGLKRVQAGV